MVVRDTDKGTGRHTEEVVSDGALSRGHGQHTKGPVNVAGEAVGVPQKQPNALPRAVPGQQADGHLSWAVEQQEPLLVHGHLEAVGNQPPESKAARSPPGHPGSGGGRGRARLPLSSGVPAVALGGKAITF